MIYALTKKNFDENAPYLQDGYTIIITKEIALDAEKMTYLTTKYPESHIDILSGYDKKQIYSNPDTLYTEEETRVLVKNVNIVKEKTGKTVTFDNQFTLEEALNASRHINDVVETIKNARVQGRELSPYEKFMYAYSYVTNRVYTKEGEKEDSAKSRSLISVLNGDKIVCVGFANLLSTLCKRLDIPCTLMPACTEENKDGKKEFTNHLACAVRIEDPLYKLSGIYYSDPTADSISAETGKTSFTMSLNRYDDLPMLSGDSVIHLQKKLDVASYRMSNPYLKLTRDDIYETDLILSYLFPEKTQGNSQDEVLYKNAKNVVNKTKLKKHIIEKIDSLTEEDMVESLKAKYRFLLKPRYLSIEMKSEENFKTFTVQNIKDLINDGFTKQEAVDFLKEIYNEDFFIQEERWLYVMDGQMSSQAKAEFDSKIQLLAKYRNSLDKIVNFYEFPEPKKISSIGEIKDKNFSNFVLDRMLSNIIKPTIIEKCLNKEPEKYESWTMGKTPKEKYPINELGKLIKMGVSRTEIIEGMKKALELRDLNAEYILETDLSSFDYDENNSYIEGEMGFKKIYNEPYEKEYKKLVGSAVRPDLKRMYTSMYAIYLSQGLSSVKAKEKAQIALSQTIDVSSLEELEK